MCARNAGQDGDGGGVVSRRSGGRVGPRPARAPPGWRVRSYSRRPATVAPVTSACGPSTIEQASLQGVREQKKIALLRRKRTKHGSRLQTDERRKTGNHPPKYAHAQKEERRASLASLTSRRGPQTGATACSPQTLSTRAPPWPPTRPHTRAGQPHPRRQRPPPPGARRVPHHLHPTPEAQPSGA